jgi:hypothetical protein
MTSQIGGLTPFLLLLLLLLVQGSMGFNLFKNLKNEEASRSGKPQHKLLAVVIDG